MKFHEQLNAYIEQIDCMAKEVSEQSGVSAATLSRYRTGSRLPDTESDAFENLCSAIAELARQKQLGDITAESVREQFMQSSDLAPRRRSAPRELRPPPCNARCGHQQALSPYKLRCLDRVPLSQWLAPSIGSRKVRIVGGGVRGARMGLCSR